MNSWEPYRWKIDVATSTKLGLAALALLPDRPSPKLRPARSLARPTKWTPTVSGGAPAARAAGKSQDRGATMSMSMAGMDMSIKAMDANGDGKVSKREYDDYHRKFWNQMRPQNGMVSMDEMKSSMEAMMKGGPN